jgi:hypothetical protein
MQVRRHSAQASRSAVRRAARGRPGVLAGALALAAGMVLASVATAFAYWTATDNAHSAGAAAATLSAPTSGAHGTATPSRIPISWTAPSGYTATGYTVLRCTGPSCAPVAVTSGGCASSAIGTATSCTDSDPGLIAGTTYTYEVTASLYNWISPASTTFQATTASVTPTMLTFTTQPGSGATITAGSPFPVSVAIQDGSANTATNDFTDTVTLAIGTGPSGGVLSCTNSGGLTVTVVAGVANFTGCSITEAGTYTLTASSAHSPPLSAPANANSFKIIAGLASQLAFTTTPVTGPTSSTANLGPISVQLQDSFGNPVTTGITIFLSSSSTGTYEFSATAGGSSETSVSVPPGSSTATFFYGDSKAGSPVITAAGGSLIAMQTEKVIAEKLVFTSSAVTGTATSSPTVGPITVQLQDGSGNPVNAGAGGVTVGLSSNSAGVHEFSATSGGSAVTSVTIPSGSSTATFYYGDETAGSPTITASAADVTSATQTETIKGGAPASLVLANCVVRGVSQACNGSYALGVLGTMVADVQALDQFGNPATITTAVTMSVTSGNILGYSITSGAALTINGTATPPDQSTGTFTVQSILGVITSGTITVHVTSGQSIPDLAFTVQP